MGGAISRSGHSSEAAEGGGGRCPPTARRSPGSCAALGTAAEPEPGKPHPAKTPSGKYCFLIKKYAQEGKKKKSRFLQLPRKTNVLKELQQSSCKVQKNAKKDGLYPLSKSIKQQYKHTQYLSKDTLRSSKKSLCKGITFSLTLPPAAILASCSQRKHFLKLPQDTKLTELTITAA